MQPQQNFNQNNYNQPINAGSGYPQNFGSNMQPQPNNPQQNPKKDSKKSKQKDPKANSTQNYLEFANFKDDVIIMKDASFRSVIRCKSINFDLMSNNEKEGVEYNYQGFLNSLYFPVQILVRSNKVDIGPYLEKLSKIRNSQDNMLLNVLMDDYINYIDFLAQEANIMDKDFYIIIPYFNNNEDISDLKQAPKSLFSGIFGSQNQQKVVKINKTKFLKAKEELENRSNSVINGLGQVGVQAQRLNSRELSQLFYKFYNPITSNQQPIEDLNNVASVYSKKGDNSTRK